MMILITNNWKLWLAGVAVSLGIFGVVYFTVIKPNSDTANQAVRAGLQESHQVINQAQQQLGNAHAQAGGAAGQAQRQLGHAAQLTSCLSAAGTDVSKVQACQAQFGR